MADIGLRDYLTKVEEMVEDNELQEAAAHLKHILRYFPKHVDAYRVMAQLLVNRDRYLDAGDLFQRVLSVDPDDFISHIGMSLVNEDSVSIEEAIWHMERAFEVQPNVASVQERLKTLYEERTRVRPDRIRLTEGALARLYFRGQLYPQAIAECRTALKADPAGVGLELILAQSLWLTGQDKEAVRIAEKVLKDLPYCKVANRIVAHVAREEKDGVHLQRLIAVDPYAEFLTPEDLTVNTGQIPGNRVRLPLHEYIPGEQEEELGQPGWADSAGVQMGAAPIDENAPDWLRDASAALSGDVLTRPGTGRLGEIADGGEEPLPDWIAENPGAIPDWLKPPGTGKLPGTGALPEWATETPDQTTTTAPDWRNGDQIAAADLAPTDSDDEFLPDWLKSGESPASMTTAPTAEEDEDWLSDFADDQPTAVTFAAQQRAATLADDATLDEEEDFDFDAMFGKADVPPTATDEDDDNLDLSDIFAAQASPGEARFLPETTSDEDDDSFDLSSLFAAADQPSGGPTAADDDADALAKLLAASDDGELDLSALFAEEDEEEAAPTALPPSEAEVDFDIEALFAGAEEADTPAATPLPTDEDDELAGLFKFDAEGDDAEGDFDLDALFAGAEEADTPATATQPATDEDDELAGLFNFNAESSDAEGEFDLDALFAGAEEAEPPATATQPATDEDDELAGLFKFDAEGDDAEGEFDLDALFAGAEEADTPAATPLPTTDEDDELAGLFNFNAESADAEGEFDLDALFAGIEEADTPATATQPATDEDDELAGLFNFNAEATDAEGEFDLDALFAGAEEADTPAATQPASDEDDELAGLFNFNAESADAEGEFDLDALFAGLEAADTPAATPLPTTDEDDELLSLLAATDNGFDIGESTIEIPDLGEEIDLPDWLTAGLDAEAETPAATAEPAEEEDELASLMATLGTPTPAADNLDLPTWLAEEDPTAQPAQATASTDLPDWLTADLSDDELPEVGETTLEMDLPDETTSTEDWHNVEIPDFLAEAGWIPRDPAIDLDAYSNIPAEIEEDTTEHDLSADESAADELAPGELPDWLSAIRPAEVDQPPAPPKPATASGPDWLRSAMDEEADEQAAAREDAGDLAADLASIFGDAADDEEDDLASLFANETATPLAFEGTDTDSDMDAAVGDLMSWLEGAVEDEATPAEQPAPAWLTADEEEEFEPADDLASLFANETATPLSFKGTDTDSDMDAAVGDLMSWLEGAVEDEATPDEEPAPAWLTADEDELEPADDLASLFANETATPLSFEGTDTDSDMDAAVGDLMSWLEGAVEDEATPDEEPAPAWLTADEAEDELEPADDLASLFANETATPLAFEGTDTDSDMDAAVGDLMSWLEGAVEDEAEAAPPAPAEQPAPTWLTADEDDEDANELTRLFAAETETPVSFDATDTDSDMDAAVGDLMSWLEGAVEDEAEATPETAPPGGLVARFDDEDAATPADIMSWLESTVASDEEPADEPILRVPADTGFLPSLDDEDEDQPFTTGSSIVTGDATDPDLDAIVGDLAGWLEQTVESVEEDELMASVKAELEQQEAEPVPLTRVVQEPPTTSEEDALAWLFDDAAATVEITPQPEPEPRPPLPQTGELWTKTVAQDDAEHRPDWLADVVDEAQPSQPPAPEPEPLTPPAEPERPISDVAAKLARAKERVRDHQRTRKLNTDALGLPLESAAAPVQPPAAPALPAPQPEPAPPAPLPAAPRVPAEIPIIKTLSKAKPDDLLDAARGTLFDEPNTALKYYGELVRRDKHIDSVIQDLEQWTPREKPAAALQLLGDACMKAGRLQDALDYYQQALRRV